MVLFLGNKAFKKELGPKKKIDKEQRIHICSL